MAEEKKPMTKIQLKSSDGEKFEVDEIVAAESQLIKGMIEDGYHNTAIPLPNVDAYTLRIVIDFCKKRVEFAAKNMGSNVATTSHGGGVGGDESKKAWDDEVAGLVKFLNNDKDTLFDLLLAANYLHIKSLLDFTNQTVADMMIGKTAEEIRKAFNIMNDFTSEEVEKLQKEDEWAFLED